MSLMEREEFDVKKIIQELQEAVDLGDAPKRGPFAVFVRKEYLVEAIAKLRDYQALHSSDTSARLAAIKDMPTERVIALAQAEAAGLVSISASAAGEAHQDAQPNEPLTLEELREMKGEPVWLKEGLKVGEWAIVLGREDLHCIYLTAWRGYMRFPLEDCGTVWFAYRRPPKEA